MHQPEKPSPPNSFFCFWGDGGGGGNSSFPFLFQANPPPGPFVPWLPKIPTKTPDGTPDGNAKRPGSRPASPAPCPAAAPWPPPPPPLPGTPWTSPQFPQQAPEKSLAAGRIFGGEVRLDFGRKRIEATVVFLPFFSTLLDKRCLCWYSAYLIFIQVPLGEKKERCVSGLVCCFVGRFELGGLVLAFVLAGGQCQFQCQWVKWEHPLAQWPRSEEAVAFMEKWRSQVSVGNWAKSPYCFSPCLAHKEHRLRDNLAKPHPSS